MNSERIAELRKVARECPNGHLISECLNAMAGLQAELQESEVNLSLRESDLRDKEAVVDMLHDGQVPDEHLWTEMKQQRDKAVKKAESLQAVVDKLPKTADGVAVVPGMKVYQFDPTGYLQSYDVGTNQARDDSSHPSPAYLVFNHACYSTEAAARAAGEKK